MEATIARGTGPHMGLKMVATVVLEEYLGTVAAVALGTAVQDIAA